jgi:hypothetical protein
MRCMRHRSSERDKLGTDGDALLTHLAEAEFGVEPLRHRIRPIGATTDQPACREPYAHVDGLGFNAHFIGRYCPHPWPEAFDARERLVVVGGDLRGRKDAVVDGRMAIRNKNNRVAKRHGAPSGRVDAEIALKATDDEAGDAPGPQEPVQFSAVKRVRCRLPQVNIAGVCFERRGQLPVFTAIVHLAALRLVLDDDHKRTGSSRLARDQIDAIDDAFDFVRGLFARAQDLLDIDDQECGRHESEVQCPLSLVSVGDQDPTFGAQRSLSTLRSDAATKPNDEQKRSLG